MAVASVVAKTTLAIGPESNVAQPLAATYTGVAAANWKLVSELASLPDIGDGEREALSYTSIDAAVVNKSKGTLNYGSGDLVVTRLEGDAGQAAMVAAFKSDKPFLFKLTLPTGAYRYFCAYVTSAKQTYGEANDFIKITFTLELTHSAAEVLVP